MQDGAIIASNKTIACQYPLIVTTISVDEHLLSNSLNLYPNPVRNGQSVLSFDLDKAATAKVEVLNNLGQTIAQVYQGQLSSGVNKFEINTANLSAGVYFVNILLNDTKVTKKLIVE